MSAPAVGRLASVIIPCWNQLEFIRQCIAALLRQTGTSWELIVVNNGSTDGSGDYLAGVQDVSPVPVTLISNATNRGFPASINQGLQYARGEYLVLLNNDVVVTDGWLSQLIGLASIIPTAQRSWESSGSVLTAEHTEIGGENHAGCGGVLESYAKAFTAKGAKSAKVRKENEFKEVTSAYPGRNVTVFELGEGKHENRSANFEGRRADCAIGLVGPMSNYAAPPQLVENVPYRDLDEMRHFARRWRDEHRGEWFTVPKLSGFCLLMKRVV